MSAAHVLVAEDDHNIRTGLVDALESEGYTVTAARDGDEALRRLLAGAFDVVLLDIMMPGKSGYDVCRELRKRDSMTPVIMLTAKGEEIDKVVGLQLGADDYVTKPFGVRELLARVAAILRRSRRQVDTGNGVQLPEAFSFADAHISRRQYESRLGDHTHSLTAREMKLIEIFHSRPGEVLSRNDLLNLAWGIDYAGTTRTLDQHIAQLRKKVEALPAEPRHLLTVHTVGYRYEA